MLKHHRKQREIKSNQSYCDEGEKQKKPRQYYKRNAYLKNPQWCQRPEVAKPWGFHCPRGRLHGSKDEWGGVLPFSAR